MASADDNTTYTLPSLLELAYYACNSEQRKSYDKLPVVPVDLQVCCESLLKIIKFNSHADRFQPHGHRRSMFSKLLTDYHSIGVINKICEMAASNGHINCLKFARAVGVPWYISKYGVWQKTACDEAADTGSIECLVYAHTNGSPWSTWTCKYAARGGHLDCLKYLHTNGCPWDDFTCTNAARYGHTECLVYAQQNGCPWNADTCCFAALNGHLECLKYCKENGCPWDTSTCEMAACSGKLDCLKYARSNGCPWSENICNVAAYYGRLDCLRYAHENGGEWDVDNYIHTTSYRKKDPSCVMYALEVKFRSLLAKSNTTSSLPDDVIP